jgi:hypothetical protein
VMTLITRRSIGKNGGNYVCRKENEVWGLEICRLKASLETSERTRIFMCQGTETSLLS